MMIEKRSNPAIFSHGKTKTMSNGSLRMYFLQTDKRSWRRTTGMLNKAWGVSAYLVWDRWWTCLDTNLSWIVDWNIHFQLNSVCVGDREKWFLSLDNIVLQLGDYYTLLHAGSMDSGYHSDRLILSDTWSTRITSHFWGRYEFQFIVIICGSSTERNRWHHDWDDIDMLNIFFSINCHY